MKAGPYSTIEALESRIVLSGMTFLVTSVSDSGPGSLRAALADADAAGGLNTVKFHLSHAKNTIALTSGSLTTDGNVDIIGPGENSLIISGNNASGVFTINNFNPTVDSPTIISGLTVEDGNTFTGGAIFSAESLTLKNVAVKDSNATQNGGGVNVVGNAASVPSVPSNVVIENCLIKGNTAADYSGGIGIAGTTSIKIVNTVVTGNTAGSLNGGGINAEVYAPVGSTAKIAITGCTISHNSGLAGGGLWLADNSAAATSEITVTGTRVAHNTSTNTGMDGAGGIYITAGSAVITGSTIVDNTAVNDGGGIDADGIASLSIIRSMISGNATTSGSGGGIFVDSVGMLSIRNSSVGGNAAKAGNGGGIEIEKTPDFLLKAGGCIMGNIAQNGGGIYALDSTGGMYGIGVNGNKATITGGGVDQMGGAVTLKKGEVYSNHAPTDPNLAGTFIFA